MSITFYAGKRVGDSVTWVFDKDEITERFYKDYYDEEGTPNPAYRPELDINMSNRNAAYVLFHLGIALEDGFSTPIDEFINRCTNLLKGSLKGGKKQGLLTTMQTEPGYATIIDWGIDQGYVEKQVLRLSILAQEGKARGAEIIYGC